MFSFVNRKDSAPEPLPVDNKPVIEGAELFDIVAPVIPLTGHRENPLKLLMTLANTPEKQRALSVVLQELPALASDSRLSDDDRLELLRPRLMMGTPSDDDMFMRYLESLAKPLFDSLGRTPNPSNPGSSVTSVSSEPSVASSSVVAPNPE